MMKKILFTLLFSSFCANVAICDLVEDKINLYNLKKDGMYLLDLGSKAEKIDVSDSKVLNVIPVISLEADGRQLFIEANDTGVCDVVVKTQNKEYKLRFVAGNVFEEGNSELILVDLPVDLSKEI